MKDDYNYKKFWKGLFIGLIFSILFYLAMFSVIGAEIFVATNGSDTTGDGSITNPYATIRKALDMASSNDIVYIRGGSYGSSANGFNITIKGKSGITLSGYQNEEVKFMCNATTITFTNYENLSGMCLWRSTTTQSSVDWYAYSNEFPYEQYFSYTKGSSNSYFVNTLYPSGLFYNTSNSYLFFKARQCEVNPNNLKYGRVSSCLYTESTGEGMNIENISVYFGSRGIYIRSPNVVINNVSIFQAGDSIRVYGSNSENITIKNSRLYNILKEIPFWQAVKNQPSLNEKSRINIDNSTNNFIIENNYLKGGFNGILFYDPGGSPMTNIYIAKNYITDIDDDAIEIENLGSDVRIINNTIENTFTGISLSPMFSDPIKTTVAYNKVNATRIVNYTGYISYEGKAVKIDPTKNQTYNVLIKQNTFIGRFYGKVNTTNVFIKNVTVIDNIFYSPLGSQILTRTGTEENNNLYDYNLYYGINGANFTYYNSNVYNSITNFEDITSYSSTWDRHSVFEDPKLEHFTPKNKNICTMSSSGSYIGAIPCEEETSIIGGITESDIDIGDDTYIRKINLSINKSQIYITNFTQKPYILEANATLTWNATLTYNINYNSGYAPPGLCNGITSYTLYYIDNDYCTGKTIDYYLNYSLDENVLNADKFLFVHQAYIKDGYADYILYCYNDTGYQFVEQRHSSYASLWTTFVLTSTIPKNCIKNNTQLRVGITQHSAYYDYVIQKLEINATEDKKIYFNNFLVINNTNISLGSQDYNLSGFNSSKNISILFNMTNTTLNGSIFFKYLYTKNINVSIKDIYNNTLNPACYINNKVYYPNTELILFNSSMDNYLNCYLFGYNNVTYQLIPYFDYLSLTMSSFGLIVEIKNEITNKHINDTMFLYVLQGNYSQNYTLTNGSIDLANISMPVGLFELQYGGDNYATRRYFIELTNTSTVNLYTLPKNNASLILFTINNEKGYPVTDSYLKVLRFFVDENAWKLIGVELTDQNGQSGMYLEPFNIPYIFIVEQNKRVIYRSSATGTKIFTSDVILRASNIEDVLESFDLLNKYLSTDLNYNNNTKILTYMWNDASGITLYGCLEVKRTSSTGTKRIIYECSNTATGTINVDLTPYLLNNSRYIVRGFIHTNTPYSEVTTNRFEWIESSLTKTFGNFGLFIVSIFLFMLFLFGLVIHFSVGVVYVILGMVIFELMGISFFSIGLIVTIFIIGSLFLVGWNR